MRPPDSLVLLAILLLPLGACRGTTSRAPASTETDAAAKAFTGVVAETANAAGYTYARLQAEGHDDVWIAAPEFPVKAGDRLTTTLETPMVNFDSKTLNRAFPLVYFVASVTRDGQVVAGGSPTGPAGPSEAPPLMASHGAIPDTTPAVAPIAPPAGGMSIAQVWADRTALAGRTITVRGQVVKVNNQILGVNWVHLQDGSGSADDRTHDLTLTTDAIVQRGDTVTFTGVLAIGKDLGSGYVYDVILEQARVVR